jgi:hypothetical protein
MKAVSTYTHRLELLEANGFVQKKGCITNEIYSFAYHHIDTSQMTNAQFEKFMRLVKAENLLKS